MADAGENLFPVAVTFSSGEQPTAVKLAGWGAQTRAGFKKLQYLIGDLWGTGGRPSSDTSKQGALFPSWAKLDISDRGPATVSGGVSGVTGTIEYRDSQIVNLARLIGPASALNPRIPSNLTATRTGEIVESGVNVTRLRSVPASYDSAFEGGAASGSWSGGGGVFTTEVATASAISASGEYHVAQDGTVTTYDTIGVGVTVGYLYFTGDGDTYPDATHNVIPDPNQTAAGVGGAACTVDFDAGSGTTRLQVTLPTITHAQSNFDGTASALSSAADAGWGEDLVLPEALDGYAAETQIPDGFVYLYDNTNKVALRDAVYRYGADNTTFFVEGLEDIEAIISDSGANATRFSVITVGTNITQSLDHLRFRMLKHQHTGLDGSGVINHSSLFNRFGKVNTSLQTLGSAGTRVFVKSEIPDNDHPQHLHRHGYLGGGTDGVYADLDASNANDANAMRGDLVMAPVGSDSTIAWASGVWGAGDSHSIWFGGAPTSIGGTSTGRTRLFFDSDFNRSSSIDTESYDESGTYFATSSSTETGLNFHRGNLLFGVADTLSTPHTAASTATVSTSPNYSVGFRTNEFVVTSHANMLSGIADAQKYKLGIRARAGYGSSIYLTTRNKGVQPYNTGTFDWNDPADEDMDTDGVTGTIVLEATTSSQGLVAVASYGSEDTWYGGNIHGAGIILSSGEGSGELIASNSAALGGIARWSGADPVDKNRGAWVHIVAGADYHSIKQFKNTSGTIDFQGVDASPYGRICLDTDRGIDLVVRTQKYTHEETWVGGGAYSATGKTRLGAGSASVAFAHTSNGYQISSDGNVAEVRLVTDTDYTTVAGTANSTVGANLNLMYKSGKNYTRHNFLVDSETFEGSPELKLGAVAGNDWPRWGWRGGRSYPLNSEETDSYGSNILGANIVEAFGGIRHDPNMPTLLTYVFPFVYIKKDVVTLSDLLEGGASGTPERVYKGFNLTVNPYNISSTEGCFFPRDHATYTQNGGSNGYGTSWPNDQDGNFLTWDQVIRHHDRRFVDLLGATGGIEPGFSVANVDLQLKSWTYANSPTGNIGVYANGGIDRAGTHIQSFLNTSSSNVWGSNFAPSWIKPSSVPNPYSPPTEGTTGWGRANQYIYTENGDPLEVIDTDTNDADTPSWYDYLYRNQVNTALWYGYNFGVYSSQNGDSFNPTMTDTFDDLGILSAGSGSDIYNVMGLNIFFGSNPYNVVGNYLPYLATDPDAGRVASTPNFDIKIHGRLILQVFGDCPYILSPIA